MLLTDSKNLWKAVKLLFTENSYVGGNNNVLSEKNKFINDAKNVSETLNSYFDNIVTTLDIRENTYIIEKLHAYDFTKYALKTIHNYLKNRYQRIKINKVFSSWCKIFSRVPQGSVLRPLVFNIYLNDMIFLAEKTDICNFADDTTFHAYDSSLDSLAKRLIMKVIKMPEFLFS